MYTSDNNSRKGRRLSVIGAYLCATVFCALFGAVYELFSHGVFSYFMIYAFSFPLLLGVIPLFLLQERGRPFPGTLGAFLIHSGVAALTLGSIMRGILDIYGTTSPLLSAYWIAGGVLTAAGWLSAIFPGGRAAAQDRTDP